MLNPFWNYASPIKNIIAQNKPTNAANNNYSYKNEKLKGALYIKLQNSNCQKLSDNCLIDINNFTNDYLLKIKYKGNELIIDNETKLFQFINSCGNKCITWQKNSNVYVLELFQEKSSKNKENIFLFKLPSITPISIEDSGIFSETKSYTKSKYINDLFSNKSKGNTYKNNKNIINKNLFMKRFEEYKEIYFVKGTTFQYDKLLEEVVPLKDKENNNSTQSLLKVNYIGNNAYILVLEQNEQIIAFIKIVNINDISINENSGSISFNYLNEKGENNPYIFSLEEKSESEMKFFKNLIMRCIYEKNNRNCDLNYIPNFLNFDSMDINSEFSQEYDSNKSFFFSTQKKPEDKIILIEEDYNNILDLDKKKESKHNLENNITSKIENYSNNNTCINKNILTNNFSSYEILDDYSGIKIFNKSGAIINTFFTKDKSPIRYIDLSHDNKYILITCDKYLAIINTDMKIKTEPVILKLDQSCLMQYNIKDEAFTYAKFFTNENSEEKMIIANFGKSIIIWNFEKVIKGEINLYRVINDN